MNRKFARELAAAGLPAGSDSPLPPITDADADALPEPARRYLRFMNVIGRPRDWSFRTHVTGRFRTRPDQAWMPMQAWQYDSGIEIARVFHLRLRMFGVLPVLGRDTYLHGDGRMLIRPLDLFTAEDVTGPEIQLSELVTYLNDAVLFAPSFLFRPEVSWSSPSAGDADRFALALTHGGQAVTAQVSVDDRGAPTTFSTTDRFVQDPHRQGHPLTRAPWSTPVGGWQTVGGRMVPTSGKAIWHLPEGDFAYADMRFAATDIAFNVPPQGSSS